jgi:hypothetical protein
VEALLTAREMGLGGKRSDKFSTFIFGPLLPLKFPVEVPLDNITKPPTTFADFSLPVFPGCPF